MKHWGSEAGKNAVFWQPKHDTCTAYLMPDQCSLDRERDERVQPAALALSCVALQNGLVRHGMTASPAELHLLVASVASALTPAHTLKGECANALMRVSEPIT